MLLPKTSRLTTEPPAPGLHKDVPATEYHAWRAVSASLLKVIHGQTAAHAKAWLDTPDTEQTDAMAFGSALHCLILEPAELDRRYFIADKIVRRGKEWEAVQAAAEGRPILWTEELATMRLMLTALREQTRARKLIRVPGAFECCLVWTDEATGLTCKARLDKLLVDAGIILDYKSAQSAAPMEFARQAANLGYDLQAGHYLNGYRDVSCGVDARFLFIAQEKDAPYLSSLIDATDERCDPMAAACGRAKAAEAMATLAQCLTTGQWPGYGDEVYPLQLPAWAIPESMRVGV